MFQFASRRRELEVTLARRRRRRASQRRCWTASGVRRSRPADGSLSIPLAVRRRGEPAPAGSALSRSRRPAGARQPDARLPAAGQRRLDAAACTGNSFCRGGEHVVASPAEFTGEYRWGWSGYFWGRQPLLDQAQLESWIGVRTSVAAVPARRTATCSARWAASNRCELRTASRVDIVLAASGTALLAGLLLIYLPAAAASGRLLAATVLLAALGSCVSGAGDPRARRPPRLGLVLALVAGVLVARVCATAATGRASGQSLSTDGYRGHRGP